MEDIKETTTEKKPTSRVHDKKKQKENADIQRDLTMVKGIFRCEEQRGGELTFHFKKYKDVPLQRYTMVDGEQYEVPLMVAEHLAQNCWYPVHRYQVDKDGRTTQMVGKKMKRYDFVSSDFLRKDDNFQRIITVENVRD